MAETFDPLRTLAEILTEHGPLHEDDIARGLRDGGVDDPDTLIDEALDEITCPARQLVDDRWVWLPALLAGRVFTHRLGADEAAHDILTVTPDLEPITALCEHEPYQRLADGSAAQIVLAGYDDELLEQRGIPDEVADPHPGLLLAPGTLGALGAAEGDLVGVRLTGKGLVVERITTLAQSAVGERLAATLDPDEPVYFEAAVWTACAEDPTAFTEPLRPLREIVDDSGLTHRGEWLAPGGFDFDRWHLETRCALLANRHDLDAGDALVLYALVNLYGQVSLLIDAEEPEVDGFADLVGELGAALIDPLLAEALVAETVGSGREGAVALAMFADVLEPKVPRAVRVAIRWLRAVALERFGDIDSAEHELLAAESIDPDWPLPLVDLARIASDRGDVERGLALLRRAGAEPDHPLVELLETYRPEPQPDLGRNEPCWCGSGRKYKKCHLGRNELPLAERAGWLYAKAGEHVLVTDWKYQLAEVSYERCRHADDDRDALDDPLVLDAVLFEGGAFEEFLEMRGSLLPDDERLLAEQWLLVDRSVFEVELGAPPACGGVHPRQGVIVRDVRTGDTHEVRERTASRQLKPGQLICARVLPAGDTKQFFGGVQPVAPHERNALIDLLDTEPDPLTLVAQLSRRFAPPTLTNTERDPLAICESIPPDAPT